MDKKNETKDQSEEVKQEQPEEIQEDSETVRLQEKIVQLEDKYKRALADYQNLQRRTQEQKAEWAKMAGREIVLKLLPVLDTLMLAEKHTKDQNFTLSVQQFLQILQDEGFERIRTVGEKFNPEIMEAVGTADGKNGEVLEEVRSGFMLNEFVLRSAQVIVGKETN